MTFPKVSAGARQGVSWLRMWHPLFSLVLVVARGYPSSACCTLLHFACASAVQRDYSFKDKFAALRYVWLIQG